MGFHDENFDHACYFALVTKVSGDITGQSLFALQVCNINRKMGGSTPFALSQIQFYGITTR